MEATHLAVTTQTKRKFHGIRLLLLLGVATLCSGCLTARLWEGYPEDGNKVSTAHAWATLVTDSRGIPALLIDGSQRREPDVGRRSNPSPLLIPLASSSRNSGIPAILLDGERVEGRHFQGSAEVHGKELPLAAGQRLVTTIEIEALLLPGESAAPVEVGDASVLIFVDRDRGETLLRWKGEFRGKVRSHGGKEPPPKPLAPHLGELSVQLRHQRSNTSDFLGRALLTPVTLAIDIGAVAFVIWWEIYLETGISIFDTNPNAATD